jgi:hypothetical protein
MNEQAWGNSPLPTTAIAAEGPFTFEDFSPRAQSWLRYQRWRYQQGRLTEFPGGPAEPANDRAGDFAQLLEPVRQAVRRLGRLECVWKVSGE